MSHNESAGCVDRMITENLKTPDRSPFCRASAQDGDSGTRERIQSDVPTQQNNQIGKRTDNRAGYPFSCLLINVRAIINESRRSY